MFILSGFASFPTVAGRIVQATRLERQAVVQFSALTHRGRSSRSGWLLLVSAELVQLDGLSVVVDLVLSHLVDERDLSHPDPDPCSTSSM